MRLRLLIAAVAISGLNGAPLRAAPATQPASEAIARLGDIDPAVRDRAQRDLRSAGAGARQALQSAARDDDPEVAVRARDLLKFKPKLAPQSPADDDAQEPSIIRYRASAPAAKRQTISFIAVTPGGMRALAKIRTLETDPELRAAIFQEMMKLPAASAGAMLAAGDVGSAELLLQTAVDRKNPGSIESYAAYSLSRGTLDDAIARWTSRGGHTPPDGWAAQVLSALYRASGNANEAIRYAEASGDRQLLRQTLLWAGDWAAVAADIRQDNAGGQTLGDLSLLVGMDAATNDATSLELDVTKLKNLAQTPQAVRTVSNVLMLIGRPNDSVELCIAAHEYGIAYEQLMLRGRFDEAGALLADHDADTSAPAALLRCTAAKTIARCGDFHQAALLFDHILRDRGATHVQEIDIALAEAEREAGMDEAAWTHFADAFDSAQPRAPIYSAAAFPARNDNVDWAGLWYAVQIQNVNQNPPRTARQIFERVRKAYDRSLPIEDLTIAISGVDLSADARSPYIGLAWEAAERMIEAGNEADGIRYAEQCASQCQSGELYIDLGDRAALNGDWATAAPRYAAAWRKDPSQPLPLYLQGLALLRCGQSAEGQQDIVRADLLAVGDSYLREQLLIGLATRGFDEAAASEANVLIRTTTPLSRPMDMALRIAGERDADHGQCAVAAALFQRSMLDFMAGGFSFPEQSMNLYLACRAARAHARALIARGEWPAAQQQIKACYDLLPDDIEVAIDLIPDLEKLGKRSEADALFNECFATQKELCKRFPDSANQHNQIAWLAAKCNREMDAALEHARQAVELMPKRTSYIDTLAEVYFVRGQYDEAIAEMKKCAKIEPMVWRHRRQIERFEAKKAAPNRPAMPTPSSGD